MDIKESIISSVFFHLILVLLMGAAASYSTGFSGGLQNVIPVDLIMAASDQPEAASDLADEEPLTSGPAASEALSLPEQAVSPPPEESKETPVPEKEVEAAPPKIENTEIPPAQTGGPPSMEAYYQFLMVHQKLFRQKAEAMVNQLLGEAFKVNTRQFYGGTGLVSLKFEPDGSLKEVLVDSASPELKAFLEEISWASMPSPARYSPGFTGVQIEFTVLEGAMSFRIEPL